MLFVMCMKKNLFWFTNKIYTNMSSNKDGDYRVISQFQSGKNCEIQDPAQDQPEGGNMTAAQRARSERNRLRARALQDARLAKHNVQSRTTMVASLDSGGGFLFEEKESEPSVAVVPPAPLVHRTEQPVCIECGHRFPQSFLFDNFDCEVCDECRDETGEHALITRTEAKTEFLLKDCDLDARPPPLRSVRRRNPHSARFGDMRLYLARQVRARALQVWGSAEAMAAERARREGARAEGRAARASRKLRALRLDVRSSLFARSRTEHTHEFGAEKYDTTTDEYSHECISCGYVETYEKM